MKLRHAPLFLLAAALVLVAATAPAENKEPLFLDPIDVHPRPIAQDPSVRYDYDIVYVRTPRRGDEKPSLWAEIAHPALVDPGGDLMLLHPDGSEELLVAGGDDGSIADPAVSFDGQWVYYSHIKGLKGTSQYGLSPLQGADIYKIHVKTRQIVRLTDQTFTPNTGAADWSKDYRTPEQGKTWLNYGVLNMGPCPLPGGRLAFVSNRNAFRPPKHPSPTLQLFVMDDDGGNVECIGHLNLGMALHPTVLKDGRIIFSSLESQGLRNSILWGLWSIHPGRHATGSRSSAPSTPATPPTPSTSRRSSPTGSIIVEEYYNQNNTASAPISSCRRSAPDGYPAFGPADRNDPRNPPLRFGRFYNGKGKYYRLAFSPAGDRIVHALRQQRRRAGRPVGAATRKDSPAVGKFTHPSAAPDNHLLTVWSPGPANHQNALKLPAIDGGIYLIKDGKPIDEPGQMLLIKNDPNYNEQWPRALVPYKRIYGIDEPTRLAPLANDGKLSPHLPEGTPFGLVGTSSLYKRESYPNGAVPKDGVTAG